MNYLLTPLEQHYDRGFGAMANSFVGAADVLCGPGQQTQTFLNSHLPICFLYRHAIELFLKSAIVILHKRLKLPYGPHGIDGEPHVPSGATWKSIRSVHETDPLYSRLKALFADHKTELASISKIAWEFSAEHDEQMREISTMDSSGTFFRYPMTKHSPRDHLKSTNKESTFQDIVTGMGAGQPAQKAFLVVNENKEVVRAFRHDDSSAQAMLETLQKAAKTFYGCHAAMRGELTGGW